MTSEAATVALTRVFREESGRALATVARLVGDIEIAEDAVQDAFTEALRTWPVDGAPQTGGMDHDGRPEPRDRPAAADLHVLPSGVVRTVTGGADAAAGVWADHARAFMQPGPTVGQRLSRAKAKIRTAGIPLRVPSDGLLPERLPAVLACVYLVFTEGYSATAGDASVRGELCDESLRLGRLLCELMPDAPEVWGLTSLMCLQDSRRRARVDSSGEAVPLDEQDRGRWDRSRISEGLARLIVARAGGGGRYTVEASIAAAHAVAPTFADTDWSAIVAAYDRLLGFGQSPAVQLNRAVAVRFRDGPEAGIVAVDEIGGVGAAGFDHTVAAVRADLLRRSGRRRDAVAEYRRAASSARTASSRRFLERRLAELGEM